MNCNIYPYIFYNNKFNLFFKRQKMERYSRRGEAQMEMENILEEREVYK